MIIENFKPQGGHHCITNSLKQIFGFYNYPISEAMLFGLGAGLGFVYVNLANSPMISGRIKPLELEQNISNSLGISIKIKKPKDKTTAFSSLKEELSKQNPVMLYADMAYFNYMNLDESNHFGGHSIVVFGFDDNESCFNVSDRDNHDWSIHTPKGEIAADSHKVPYEEMGKARNSAFRPFPAKNKWLCFDFSESREINKDIVFESIRMNTNNMLNPPANLLGINGIRKFAKELIRWKSFDSAKIKLAGITNYFMINAKGGTGGGAFRNLYGSFLLEAGELTNNKTLSDCGKHFHQIGLLWEEIAVEMMNLYETANPSVLDKLPASILKIADLEEFEFKTLLSISSSC